MKTIVLLFFLGISSYGFSQQLTYTPKNPAFGGDPFNYTWLLNSANAQNSFSDPLGGFDAFDLESLGGLNSADQLVQQQFGGDRPTPGTTTNGNLEFEVFESTLGTVVNILDITTGEQTQIILPN